MPLKNISLLKNPIQEYAWGSKKDIQTLLGKPEDMGKPMAEMWMGAHPKAPSQVLVDGKWQRLDTIIEKDPESILGRSTAKHFSNQLPFLFKILAAGQPLSVQVHPNLQQAIKGFSREQNLRIPAEAPNRNYKDANHKPEILCALTPFHALKGFRNIRDIIGLMDTLALSTLSAELNSLRKKPDVQGFRTFYATLMHLAKSKKNLIAEEAVRSADKFADTNEAFQWIIKLNNEYPGDIGVLSPVILNLVMLAPGEAIYLPAGELHAYLAGLGIELMANSDNVLRGGLTPKHIDVPELLSVVNFEPQPVRKVTATKFNSCLSFYKTPSEEFQLSIISVSEGNAFTSTSDRSVEILICLEGEAEIEDLRCNATLPLTLGQSIVIPSQVSRYRIVGNAALFMASVPG